jgi:predicted nucleic acid-binding protein
VEWGRDEDLGVAQRICARYRSLRIGPVDALAIAAAQRLKAEAIATLDLRHFAAVAIRGNPRLLPRDR